uniref:Uncharacterized protein n=1 Tax=Sphaerodactylus townsendi TaxID=933632 RepID=A0ACB8EWX6_9SAUR
MSSARPAGTDLAPFCESDLDACMGDEQLLSEVLQGVQQRMPKGIPFPNYFPGEPYPFLSYGGERKPLGAFDSRCIKEEPRGGDPGRAGGRHPYNAPHFPAFYMSLRHTGCVPEQAQESVEGPFLQPGAILRCPQGQEIREQGQHGVLQAPGAANNKVLRAATMRCLRSAAPVQKPQAEYSASLNWQA